ncbi:RNA polymerase sigma factor RpoE [Methylophaga thiooxydans]|uniref:RNA polymerase sigma factor RpoE n=2 Tax=Methylophaga thiooxydans TaxID=392484 RepID=C0N4S3_9GAMM|nr:RNA polymerase sigma factor RpoE [Methylophaga thiooxydans]EEF80256.1 RNA polymerase sigma factor RpoE [Methylophaga thiooxydans DMS010]KGM06039.1 RNA polymerase sigma factor RpoE [Methylophaga thiooxydans]|mmetsp:Transcript_24616/g.31540  ORF Transcript_24616/g.31540 Transcript_24616/m.31540 type:complete len:193 (+) Transcript_24616:139-717(+)
MNVDQELVRRVQAGDKKAFDLLIMKYQQRIIHVITGFVHDPVEAMDVAQEAFIKAYRALPGFRGDSAFYTWLYRIAINTSKNYLTAASRRPPVSDVDAMDATIYYDAPELKEFETPESSLMSDELKQAIHLAIQDLPEDTATAIKLREFEGLSYEEIAQAMDCPIGTVRSRIFRAREAIDKQVKAVMGGEEQ